MSRGIYRRQTQRALLATSVAAALAGCSQSSDPPARTVAGVSRSVFSEEEYGVRTSERVTSGRVAKGGGSYKLGSPYKVAGKWYVPREEPGYDRTGTGSWYGADFHGRRTANGEVFDAYALTAAHPTLPLPCYAYVTNVSTGKTILVRVNDRGPYVNDRLIDLSYASAKALGYTQQGHARVRVRYAGRAPLHGDDSRERQFLASQPWDQRGDQRATVASNTPPPTRELGSPVYSGRSLPAESYGTWSPTEYRARLAGKPVPQQTAKVVRRPADKYSTETASLPAPRRAPAPQPFAQTRDDRMSLSSNGDRWPAGNGRTYVQVGIYRERSNAERVRHELSSLGPIEVAPMQLDGGREAYRVRIGPFSQDRARTAQNNVANYGVRDSAIVTE